MKNYGFIPDKIEPEHYIFGSSSIPQIILEENSQWDKYLPLYEPQFENFETWGCTVWGTLNAIEILHKRLFNIEPNYSERFLYILAGVREPGSTPHLIAETIRKNGLINQEELPITETYEEFIKPDPMSKLYLSKGEDWLSQYEIKHEWVSDKSFEGLKEALKYSPFGIAVYAWAVNSEGLFYRPMGAKDSHWCVLFGYVDGLYWKVFDSYDQSIKYLTWNFGFNYVKRYYLRKKEVWETQKKNWFQKFVEWLKRLFHGL
ncbi:MAG: hypothetical protein QMD65_01970 [Patescibacteria group bacterium]|nr:hypothetical protein [Patescibacteria group bacterium]